jgi:Uncharacterised nucleotidyltransferase
MDHAGQIRFLCRCLAPATVADPDFADLLSGGDVLWPQILWLAGNHLVTPSLSGALRRRGVFDVLPGDIREYLDAIRELNRERNRILYDELIAVAQRLNHIDVEPILLKGAIALLPDQYPGAEDRVIGDLDLLLPLDRIDEAFAALRKTGYHAPSLEHTLPGAHKRNHHAPPLLHPELPVEIELHKRMLFDDRAAARLRARMVETSIVLPGADVRMRVPDLATRLLHNFLHNQIQDRNHALFSMNHRQLLEFVQLRESGGARLDWASLVERLRPEHRRAFAVYLLAAEHWYGQPYPPELARPAGSRLMFMISIMVQSRRDWHRAFAPYVFARRYLPRLLKLPLRFLTPGWFVLKYRALRRGERL